MNVSYYLKEIQINLNAYLNTMYNDIFLFPQKMYHINSYKHKHH